MENDPDQSECQLQTGAVTAKSVMGFPGKVSRSLLVFYEFLFVGFALASKARVISVLRSETISNSIQQG